MVLILSRSVRLRIVWEAGHACQDDLVGYCSSTGVVAKLHTYGIENARGSLETRLREMSEWLTYNILLNLAVHASSPCRRLHLLLRGKRELRLLRHLSSFMFTGIQAPPLAYRSDVRISAHHIHDEPCAGIYGCEYANR